VKLLSEVSLISATFSELFKVSSLVAEEISDKSSGSISTSDADDWFPINNWFVSTSRTVGW